MQMKIKTKKLIIKKVQKFQINNLNTTANYPKSNTDSLRDQAGPREFLIKARTYKRNHFKKINRLIKMQIYFTQTNKAIKMYNNH